MHHPTATTLVTTMEFLQQTVKMEVPTVASDGNRVKHRQRGVTPTLPVDMRSEPANSSEQQQGLKRVSTVVVC